jgi:hypothetical protein
VYRAQKHKLIFILTRARVCVCVCVYRNIVALRDGYAKLVNQAEAAGKLQTETRSVGSVWWCVCV